MSHKIEGTFLLTAHYCKSININNTHIEIPSTPATDGVSLYKSIIEVVENFVLEENIVVITFDVGKNIRVCREAME